MVQAVDRHLFQAQIVGQVLATSGVLSRNHLAVFHQRAREVITATNVGVNIVLSDASGQQLVNTLREFGEPLPRHGHPDVLRRVFASREAVISGIYIGGLLQRPVASIDLPVVRDGKVMYVLSVGLLPDDFTRILIMQNFPPGWVSAVFDDTGTIAGRTQGSDEFVGQKGTAEYIRRIRESPEGTMETVTREGIRTLSAWSRSPTTSWSVGIGIPMEMLEHELWHTMVWLASGLAILLALGLGLAWKAGQAIAASVRALTQPANALGRGEPAAVPDVLISESAEVASAIGQAGTLLAARTAALEAANENLERLVRVDALTGLQNRKSANERLREDFLRLKRSGHSYAVVFMDIDHFKEINDTHGHETGDLVLKRVASVLLGSLRQTDFLARYGGEEFLAILSDTGVLGALRTAEVLRANIAGELFPVATRVTLSLGVSVALIDDENHEEAVHRADVALYQAKEVGRNAIRPFLMEATL